MPVLMMFSRPIAPGFRRKSLEGCYLVGQWIVIPEDRRIQKNGRVIGLASNIIDALVCLIEAKGEFVSLARLNAVLWPVGSHSSEDTERYISALQEALEGHVKAETYIERSSEHGYRLLVNARPAVAEDVVKYDPPKRQVPDDPFKVDSEGARYVLAYHGRLMTDLERRAWAHSSASRMMEDDIWEDAEPDYKQRQMTLYEQGLSTDPAVLELLADGYEAFAIRAASRILEEHGERLSLNRCPRCGCIARTPRARQCRYCGHDWHDE